jgi:hypothetical protein
MARNDDAFRTAEALLRLHGDERAEQEAQELWRLYKANGATNAARVWQRVSATLNAMRAKPPRIVH